MTDNNTKTPLAFDEFRAITRRQNAKTDVSSATTVAGGHSNNKHSNKTFSGNDADDFKDTAPIGAAVSNKTKGGKTTSATIYSALDRMNQMIVGIVEQNELQALYVCLLLLDTFCSFMTLIINYGLLFQQTQYNYGAGGAAGMGESPGYYGSSATATASASGDIAGETVSAAGLSGGGIFSQMTAVFTTVLVWNGGYTHPLFSIITPVLQSISTFSLFIFCVEILLVVTAFRLRALTHLGYVMDLVIIMLQLYEELGLIPSLVGIGGSVGAGSSSAAVGGLVLVGGAVSWRVLNLFRCWRLVRLYTSLVTVEIDKHEVTKNILEQRGKELKVVEIAKYKLENDLRKEQESLVAVETMLTNYKEEVYTLNEALKIAALDIAEIAQGDDEDEEGEVGSGGGGAGYMFNDTLNALHETLSAQEQKGNVLKSNEKNSTSEGSSTNVQQVHRHVRMDASAGTIGSGNTAGKTGSTVTTGFIIHDDGSFKPT